jgi:hypothetical protein
MEYLAFILDKPRRLTLMTAEGSVMFDDIRGHQDRVLDPFIPAPLEPSDDIVSEKVLQCRRDKPRDCATAGRQLSA